MSDTPVLEAECLVSGKRWQPWPPQLASLGMEPSPTSKGKHDWEHSILSITAPKVEPLSYDWGLGRRGEPPPLGYTRLVLSFNNM